jgi:hypothetical protein
MEKRLYISPAPLACTCANHYVLMPGSSCDLCMGIVMDQSAIDDLLGAEPRDLFDQSYFEALERMFEDIDYAA